MTEQYELGRGIEVTGSLKFFNPDKGFGFVSVSLTDGSSLDVFIRQEKARRVTGTYRDYVLGDEAVSYSPDSRNKDVSIVLVVEPAGSGKWRAARWGVRPEYTWIDLCIESPDFECSPYVGGVVRFDNWSRYGSGGYAARVETFEVTRTHVKLTATRYPSGWQYGDTIPENEMGRRFTTEYPLEGVARNGEPSGFELTWRDSEDESSNRLAFERRRSS